jgi:hypothetical protein
MTTKMTSMASYQPVRHHHRRGVRTSAGRGVVDGAGESKSMRRMMKINKNPASFSSREGAVLGVCAAPHRRRVSPRRSPPARIAMVAASSSSSSPSDEAPIDVEASAVIDVESSNDGTNDGPAPSAPDEQQAPQQPETFTLPSGPPPALYQIALTGAMALWSGWTASLALAPSAFLQIAFDPSNVDFTGWGRLHKLLHSVAPYHERRLVW